MGCPRILSRFVILMLVVMLGWTAPVAADTDLPIGGIGQVSSTNGDGVRMRETPSVSADTLKVLNEGWRVLVLAGPVSGDDNTTWYKVNHTGMTGYVVAAFLTTATGANGGVLAGETAQVATDDGAPLRLREKVDGDVLGVLPNGGLVSVQAGPATDGRDQRWFQVSYNGQQGWAFGSYLRPAVQQPTTASSRGDTTSRSGNRSDNSGSAQSAPPPKPTATPAPPPPAPAPAPPAASARSSGSGATFATAAQQYVGRPYVFGGTTPAGFDCSGLVMYVAQRALGLSLGRDVAAQYGAGVPVSSDDLRVGDLVFFKNTYRMGLSHVGIYVGGGRMVNAQSESTGVRVQYMWDSYWGPRYYGARRITSG